MQILALETKENPIKMWLLDGTEYQKIVIISGGFLIKITEEPNDEPENRCPASITFTRFTD